MRRWCSCQGSCIWWPTRQSSMKPIWSSPFSSQKAFRSCCWRYGFASTWFMTGWGGRAIKRKHGKELCVACLVVLKELKTDLDRQWPCMSRHQTKEQQATKQLVYLIASCFQQSLQIWNPEVWYPNVSYNAIVHQFFHFPPHLTVTKGAGVLDNVMLLPNAGWESLCVPGDTTVQVYS